jgi:hypothetical protein
MFRTWTRRGSGRGSPTRDHSRTGSPTGRQMVRQGSPPSHRSTVSRTPSPSLGKRGGAAGSNSSSFRADRYTDKGGNGSSQRVITRVPRDNGGAKGSYRETRERNFGKRDSRELEGWSRGEQHPRYPNAYWW